MQRRTTTASSPNSQTDFTKDLKKINVPVLVMHSEDDQIVPYVAAGPLSAKLRERGTLKTYKDFPHGMITTQADTINADLLAIIGPDGLVGVAVGARMHAYRDGGDWRPLEAGVAHPVGQRFELALAAHVKNVPGRKTDVNDAAWLPDLMAHRLIRGSFVPEEQTQEVRRIIDRYAGSQPEGQISRPVISSDGNRRIPCRLKSALT
jgi:hypothetical protein